MQMFRQNHHGVDSEGMPFFHHADNLTEYNVGVRSSPQPCMMKLHEMLPKESNVLVRDLLGRPSQPEGWF
jgi:hypothetical protein